MSYKINLPFFEGPMDLLLYLIKKNEIDIYDIPIAVMLEQYLEYVEMLKVLNLESIGEFLVMAATLVQIKSRMLLPKTEHEEEEETDPREELLQRLLEYKSFKEAASQLAVREAYYSEHFNRKNPANGYEKKKEEVLVDVSVFELIKAFQTVLTKVGGEAFHEVSVNNVSVNDKVSDIMERLEKEESIVLQKLFETMTRKIEMVVTFLALLELMRLKLVKVVQDKHFEEIIIYAR